MTNKKTLFITLLCIAIAFIFLFLTINYTNKIPSNPEGHVGNSAGNLNNKGLFCESDGIVYFSNPYDNGCLYAMNPDQSDIKKINNVQVKYINAGKKHLYYYQVNSSADEMLGFVTRVNGLYRSTLKGTKTKCLSKNVIETVSLVDNTLYYQQMVKNAKTLQLYSINTDKTEETVVFDYLVNPACADNGILYYNGTVKDHYLYGYDTKSKTDSLILEKNMWYPIVSGGYVYYLDIANDYRLCRYNFASGNEEVLTNDRVDTYNICDTYIYYQKNSSDTPALMRIGLDGSSPEMVAEGNYSNINVTSQYVYFNLFGSEDVLYYTPTYGGISVSTFEAAKQAALQQ